MGKDMVKQNRFELIELKEMVSAVVNKWIHFKGSVV